MIPERPQAQDYGHPIAYMEAMLDYRRATEDGFTVKEACRRLRRVSPSLVSLILKGRRRITVDRIDALAKLLGLTTREKYYFRDWIIPDGEQNPKKKEEAPYQHPKKKSRRVSSHILSDWLNVYVKDAFRLIGINNSPKAIYKSLAGLATQKRIDRSLDFLIREGYLRRTMDGKIVEDTPLLISDEGIADKKIQQFHKAALRIARDAIDLYPIEERLANAMVLPLTKAGYKELLDLIGEFAVKIQNFDTEHNEPGDRLYQLLINLSPTGGSIDKE